MSVMALGFNLLPQERRFYDWLEGLSESAYGTVHLMAQVIAVGNDEAQAMALTNDMLQHRQKADKHWSDLTQALCKTFVTPIDREDISALAYGLYNMVKTVDKCQQRILAFHVTPINDDLLHLTQHMSATMAIIHPMVQSLRSIKNIQAFEGPIEQLHQHELVAERLVNESLVALMREVTDARVLILHRDVLNLIEHVYNHQNETANSIIQVVLKHS